MSLVKPKKIEQESVPEVPARSERCEDQTSSKIKPMDQQQRLRLKRAIFIISSKMSDNKLVKTLTDVATITGIAAGYGWIAKKVVRELMTSDPSVNLMNYVNSR